MPTTRHPIGRKSVLKITPESISAWKRADFDELHCLLGLAPREASPLPYEITALGCSEDDLPLDRDISDWNKTPPKAVALQRQFLAVAGWPDCRAIYEEELRDAEKSVAYYRELVEHPGRGGQGTGTDPESRRKALDDALAKVKYRKRLLAELDAVRAKWAPAAGAHQG
jgi:hypothetical protein